MANPFSLFQIPSAQNVQQAVTQERQQAYASGNPYAMQQATFGTAIDALFGNPQVMQAQKIQKALQGAEKGLVPQEGETQVDTELRRLQAMRDAVADVDPAVASQINSQMLQLGQVKLEQDKLRSDMNTNYLKNIETSVDIASKTQKVGAAEADFQNWMNPTTGQMIAIKKADAASAAALSAKGWVEAGMPQLSGSKEGITGLTKPVTTDLQTAVFNSAKQLDTFYGMAGKWEPRFSTVPTQIAMAGEKYMERLTGMKLGVEDAAAVQKFYEWRRNTTAGLNEYIKYITGAQAAVAEYERIEKSFPNDKMGPTEYVSALRSAVKQTIGISKRAQEALAHGMKVTPEMQQQCSTKGMPCIWDSVNMPPVSDEEVDAFLAPLGIPARGSNAQVEKKGTRTEVKPGVFVTPLDD
jgi:hypothetical protein